VSGPTSVGLLGVGWLLVGFLAMAATASAQSGGALLPPAAPPRGPWFLSLALGVAGGYDDNARFAVAHGPSDREGQAAGEMVAGVRGARGKFQLSARGDDIRYYRLNDLDQFNYQFGGSGSYEATERLTMRIDGLYRTALTTVAGPAVGGLPYLPNSISHSENGTVGWSYKFSPLTTGTIDVHYFQIDFETPGLFDGAQQSVTFGVASQYASSGSSAGVTYLVSQSSTTTGPLILNTAGANWSPVFSAEWRAHLEAGATLVSGEGAGALYVRPTGEADLRFVDLPSSGSLRYAHTIDEVFGLGQLLTTDELDLLLARDVVGKFTILIGADQGWSNVAEIPGERLTTTTAYANVRHTIVGNLWFGLGGYLRRRAETSTPTVSGSGIALTAGYVWAQ